ncbi:MAG: type IV-A pilus assembly ATPase PilB, partial [Burkholderiales bacterium]
MSAISPGAPAGTALSGLARALVQQQMLRLEQAVAIQKKADAARSRFVDEVVQLPDFPPARLAQFASETFGLPLLDLQSLLPSAVASDLIDARLLAESRIVPVAKRGNRLTVLLSDPTDLQAIDRVKFHAQAAVDPVVVEHDKLLRLIEKLGRSTTQELDQLVGDGLDIALLPEEAPPAAEEATDVDDAPIVKFLQKVLMDAIHAGASDIHFEP